MALPELVVFDVDGTLVDFDGRTAQATRQAIVDLRAAGVPVAVATGRPLAALHVTLDQVGPVDYAACGNGTVLVEVPGRRVLHENALPTELIHHLGREMRAALPGVGLAVETRDSIIEEAGFARRLPPMPPNPIVDDALAALDRRSVVHRQIFFHDDYDENLPALAGHVERHLGDRGSIFFGTTLPIVEVLPVDDDKAIALAALAAHLAIDAGNAVAIGDGTNDLGMLQWAGLGVAMGNARDVVKAGADRVIDAIDDGGIAPLVAELLKG